VVHVIDKSCPDLGGNVRHGDVHTWVPGLWRHMVDRFAINSVLDVGCGEGHAVRFFHRIGLYAHGIDGLATNIANAVAPISLHNILTCPYVMPVDLVWSCEVAEHIVPDKVGNYLDTLANARVVAITHAEPDQAGYHHVNCQPDEYWIDGMNSRGYTLAEENPLLRQISKREETWNYFTKTGLVFLRR
jgi:cyclopropane fatty-acyl-phospholipid synthase-like methyltransferase